MIKKILFCALVCTAGASTLFSGDFSIGRHIITRGKIWSAQETLLYLQLDDGSITDMTSSVAYGITDTLGFQINIPVLVEEKRDNQHYKGLENIAILGQWHFHQNPENVAALIGGFELPTQTFRQPPFDMCYLADLIFVHSSEQWFTQAELEMLFVPKHDGLGEHTTVCSFFLGAGPKINYKGSPLFTLFSIRGFEKTKTDHIIFIGPLFAYIKGNLTLAVTFEWPIAQEVERDTPRIDWGLGFLVKLDF